MISKAFHLLRRNPVLVLFYVTFLIISMLIFIPLYPSNYSSFTTDYTNFDFVAYGIAMMKMMIAMGLLFLLGLFFTSGYNYMISEAVVTGSTTATSFLQGVKRFFVRVLLSMLLIIAFAIGFSIVTSILMIPITFALMMAGNPAVMALAVTIITMVIVIFAIPFFFLWTPAIFLDDIGIIQGLKNGVKAGAKNYLKLILLVAAIYVPIIIYIAFNINTMVNGQIFSVGYFVLLAVEAIISVIYPPLLFMIYFEYKQKIICQKNITPGNLDANYHV